MFILIIFTYVYYMRIYILIVYSISIPNIEVILYNDYDPFVQGWETCLYLKYKHACYPECVLFFYIFFFIKKKTVSDPLQRLE